MGKLKPNFSSLGLGSTTKEILLSYLLKLITQSLTKFEKISNELASTVININNLLRKKFFFNCSRYGSNISIDISIVSASSLLNAPISTKSRVDK